MITKVLLCSLLFLSLAAIAGRAAAAEATGSTAGRHRASTKPVKGRQKAVHKKARSTRAAATPAKPAKRSGRKASQATAAAAAVTATAAPTALQVADAAPALLPRCGFTDASKRQLFSRSVYLLDEKTNTLLYERNADAVAPIASVSKLMTAIVWLDQGNVPMNNHIEVTDDDLDTLKFTQSRLRPGAHLSRADMLHIALMSSENRAAAALSRDYPGGRTAFIAAMNAKAQSLGMPHTRFVNATGLSPENVSTAKELATLVRAADNYKLIRSYSVDKQDTVNIGRGQLHYINSNRLVRYGQVHASLQKTGFIDESGHNMVMRVMVHDRRPVIVTLLGAGSGNGSRLDGARIAKWLDCSLP